MMQIWKFFHESSSFSGGQIIHKKLAPHRYCIIENQTSKKTNVCALAQNKGNYTLPAAFGAGPRSGPAQKAEGRV